MRSYGIFCHFDGTDFKIRISETGQIKYTYFDKINDFGASWSFLSEVGEPYRPWFENALEQHGHKRETRDIDVAPWCADFAIKKENKDG